MNNSVLTIIKLNLKNIRAAYIVTIAGLAMFIAQIIIIDVLLGLNGVGQNTNISASWALWALPVMAAILIPARHFRRVVSLGGKRDSFFRGCFLTYLYLAGLVSLIVTIYSYTIDQVLINSGIYAGVITVPDVFGWSAHGPVLVFVQQFAFLFLTAAFVHLLTAMQGKWYGFALDRR